MLVILLGDWAGALIYAISTNRRFSLRLNGLMVSDFIYTILYETKGLRMRFLFKRDKGGNGDKGIGVPVGRMLKLLEAVFIHCP